MNEQTPSVVAAPVLRPMLPGTGSLLKATWSDFIRRFWTYIGISLIPFLFFVIVGALGGFGFLVGQSIGESGYLVAGGVLLIIVAVILAIVVSLWSQVALIHAITNAEQNVGIKESFRQTWGKVGSYLWITIISGFIIMCGMMLFAIPGIIFAVWFLFPVYILVNEGDRGFSALMKSREYVRNYWFPVLGRIILMGLVIGAFLVALMIIVGIIGFAASNSSVISVVMQIIQQVAQLIIYPFIYIFYVKIYLALKTIKGQVVLGEESQKDKKLITVIAVLGFLMPILLIILLVAVPLMSR